MLLLSIMDTLLLMVPINTVGRLFGYNPGLSGNKIVEDIKKWNICEIMQKYMIQMIQI